MWRITNVLGVLLCCAAPAAAAGPAEYRFQALVDRDQSAQTGCDFESPAGTVHGKELRVYAETDRTQILRVVTEQCEAGAWREVNLVASATPLGLAQGTLGSDAIEFDIQRNWLGDAQAIDLQLFGQNIESGAFDFIGNSDGSGHLLISIGGSVSDVQLLGQLAAVLFACGVVLIARRHQVALRSRAVLLLLALLGLGSFAIAPVRDSYAGLLGTPVEIADPANDSVGKDAGVDFVGASIRASGAGLSVRLDVNNIKADGLADHSKVLFIGNSLTYVNDLPGMLSAIAAQAGKTLVTAEVAEGGFALEDHFRVGRAQVEIAKGYDLVILQQGPSSLKASQVNLLQWATRFDPLIRASGARPALYMVWPELARFDVFDDVRDSYSNAALAIDGMFIPGGEAWRESWRIDPALKFYGADDFHPSTLGTYAIALSMFAELFRQTPADLPATFSLANGTQIALDPAQVRAVQQGAWEAHLQFGRAGR
jgi:hypothetical protein